MAIGIFTNLADKGRTLAASFISLRFVIPNSYFIYPLQSLIFFNESIYFNWRIISLQYCDFFAIHWHESAMVYMCSPSWTPSNLPPYPILQGHPSAPALSTLSHALNLDWRSLSHMVVYMCQCYYLKSSHPRLLPQSTKDCSLHLCLFCCLVYRVIITIFLNSIYMR